MSDNDAQTISALKSQIASLQSQIASLDRFAQDLATRNTSLVQENKRITAQAAKENEALRSEVKDLRLKNARLVESIKLANMRFFGSKSEKVYPGQLSLFNGIEAAATDEVEPALDQVLARPRRRGGKRRINTQNMERIVIEHVIDDPHCDVCGEELSPMKVEVREIIKLVPAHLVVEEHRRQVYRCESCCKANAEGKDIPSQIVRAPMPVLSPLYNSFASPSLISYILNAKYVNSLPLYRLEQDLSFLGARIDRSVMANWVMACHERWLGQLTRRLKDILISQDVIQADESEVQVLKEPEREAKQKSWMWLFRSGKVGPPITIYEYHPTRSKEVPRKFLKDFRGYLMTDGYDPYFNLGIEGITNLACLSHIRRKYVEIIKVAGGEDKAEHAHSVALEARRRIDDIFSIEHDLSPLSPKAKKNARQNRIAPLLDELDQFAQEQILSAMPGMALYKALAYTIKYLPYVKNVLKDGRLEFTNNLAEQSIKVFVIGRKNWLFSDTPRGAEASASIYSLATTAKLNGLDPRKYFEWVLAEMPNDAHLADHLDDYLPISECVPEWIRLSKKAAEKAATFVDEPIIDEKLVAECIES